MADKPSRALIIYGYGLAPHIKPSHTHIHSLASIACCGFLALDNYSSPISDREDEKLIRELAQLLDANEAVCYTSGGPDSDTEAPPKVPTMKERFMGMRAAIVSSSSAVRLFGEELGFTVVDFEKLIGQSSDFAADELLKMLGFQDGQTLDKDHFDLVFVHTGAHAKEHVQNDLEYTNNLLGRILQVAGPGTDVGSRLHLSLVMSHGAESKDDPNSSLLSLNDVNSSNLQYLFPRQSYTLKGVDLRSGIRHHSPMLVAQWQDAVTRKDMAQEFSFDEFRKKGGNLAIATDRFLYEVAFKLWKAPKYGA